MMTVAEMKEHGVILDGKWGFKKWDKENCRYIHIPKEKGLYMEIFFMYSEDGMIVFEVE